MKACLTINAAINVASHFSQKKLPSNIAHPAKHLNPALMKPIA
jgi:hypothetical protein